MAPRGTPKSTQQIQRSNATSATEKRAPPVLKPTMTSVTKPTANARFKKNNMNTTRTRTTTMNDAKEANTAIKSRMRTHTDPRLATPKANDNKITSPAGSTTKSGKKSMRKWKPKAAHSGVPVPEKMKKLILFLGDSL